MADEAQIIYEYTNGNTISFKTNNLKITYHRHFLEVAPRPDGNIYVDDPGAEQRVFTFSAIITGADMNTLDGVQMAAITYDATYPRIQKIYWDGATTETNIPIAITALSTQDMGNGFWNVNITMEEYTTA
jgi:hypothetical protein